MFVYFFIPFGLNLSHLFSLHRVTLAKTVLPFMCVSHTQRAVISRLSFTCLQLWKSLYFNSLFHILFFLGMNGFKKYFALPFFFTFIPSLQSHCQYVSTIAIILFKSIWFAYFYSKSSQNPHLFPSYLNKSCSCLSCY